MFGAARPPVFYGLAVLFGLFVVFLYGPIATVVMLAFQGQRADSKAGQKGDPGFAAVGNLANVG
jgi:ABC-type spermidine/putrescine transport system permease subunit II